MKLNLIFLGLISTLFIGLEAQEINFFDDFDTNPFTLAYGVNPNLILFTPDSGSQIFFNPARAVKYQRQFIVGKYDNYNRDISPIFDFAILKKYDDSYFLFQIGNSTDSYSNQNYSQSNDIPYLPEQQFSSSQATDENTSSKTKIKLSKIFSLDETAYSYSLFGHYYSYTYNSFQSSSSYRKIDDESVKSSGNDNRTSDRKSFSPEYSLGAEVSVLNDISDLILSIQVVKGKKEQDDRLNSVYHSEYIYKNISRSSDYTNNTVSYQSSYLNPTLVIFNGFYQRNLTLWNVPSNTYVSIDVFYLHGDKKLKSEKNNFVYSKSDSNAPIFDTTISNGIGSILEGNYGIKINTGILGKWNLDDIEILSGIVPEFYYAKTVDGQIVNTNSRYIDIYKQNKSIYSLDMLLPIMISYTPTEWLTIFGGVNIHYMFNRTDGDFNSFPLSLSFYSSTDSSSGNYQLNRSVGSSTDTHYSSTSLIFLNTQFRARSGFIIQVSFKNNITNFKEFGISLMYPL